MSIFKDKSLYLSCSHSFRALIVNVSAYSTLRWRADQLYIKSTHFVQQVTTTTSTKLRLLTY